ncbi:DNA-binding transcriptional regulator [Magnetovirga frankeli]|uniref:helix-turn-helix domain-containing protein n=1 Tax=Magnetovirga frankeli TaxID=947516 RepID=UPI001293249C|nr:DNA-binding transcriptional regulator [gamma proteobacterium SS-5]
MNPSIRGNTEILQAVHETASDLHRGGLIDAERMQHYDLLCLSPIPSYDSEQIRSLRQRFHMSQAVLARLLNTSLSAVQQWEEGEKHPSGPSQKLLNLLERKGLDALL